MNILYSASTDEHLRRFHRPCLDALVRRGHTLTAAAAGTGEGLPEGVRFLPTPFVKRMSAPANLRCAAALGREMSREPYDLVVTNTALASFFTRMGAAVSVRKPGRIVNIVHGYLFDTEPSSLRREALLAAERLTASVTDEILVMNRTDALSAKKYRLCRGAVGTIPGMGVDLHRFSPAGPAERAQERASLGFGVDEVVLVYAAEFSKRKNQRLLLEAMACLGRNIRLVLPGAGTELDNCMALAQRLGVADRVRFPGPMEDVRPLLLAGDICVSSSRSEGLPFHVMEAMGCALPCVLTDIKGHRDLLEDTGAGILCPPSPDSLAAAVAVLARSDELRHRLGRAARRCWGIWILIVDHNYIM